MGFRHDKLLPYQGRLRAVVITRLELFCYVTRDLFFVTRAPAFLFRTAAGGRCLPAVEENATNERPRRNEVCLVMAVNDGGLPPILAQKHDRQRSAFTSENLLREARRQKRITDSSIPNICVLDPDGNIVRSLLAGSEAMIAIAADRLRSRLP